MQEIPILVVLMYQLFKQQIHDQVSEFIPLIMEFINMKPLSEPSQDPSTRKGKFIDFMAAQVKTLSFLAYVIKIYQELVEQHSSALVKGMMNLLVTCPPSVTNMRKEFFIATRHILSTQEIRPKFLSVLDDLMNEDTLIGQGFTVRDALRPLAYSTLADLTHHLRSELSLTKMARATDLFGRNMFDDSLPFSIQQMSLRLLLNLAECIRLRVTASATSDAARKPINAPAARRLLLQIMRLCVLKCQLVAEHYLPEIESRCLKEETENPVDQKPLASEDVESEGATTSTCVGAGSTGRHDPFLTSEALTQGHLSFGDLRALTKALATGMRAVVTSLTQCPHWSATEDDSYLVGEPQNSASVPLSKQLLPTETLVLTDYLTYGLRMIDVLRIISKDGQLYLRGPHSGAKYPDERFLLETLAMTFVPISSASFREIFSVKIEYIVDWCRKSPLFYAHFAFHLLSQSSQTSNFGHILLSFLVDRLEKLGDGTDVSFTYMRLLKFCFNSVNMPGTDNEHVMKLHLRRIVQGSMQYCLEAREPTAYLTLLRTLFRSIGGGAHDKLYREFFPLLPEMLTTLNRLLRSAHRTYARDLLGELCVIVPVRLSTLLPYLSLLMEPLIYVLNCNTVNQGLRTLELCVDNMQPDFLYEHLYPVRGDMLLALYTSLHSQSEYVQKMAFKVLGKLGRYNRADISDVQRLNLSIGCGEPGPLLRFWLHEFPQSPVDLPIRSLVDVCVEAIQDTSMDPLNRLRAWEFLRGICFSALNFHTYTKTTGGSSSFTFVDSLPTFPLQQLFEQVRQLESTGPANFNGKPSIHHQVMVRVIGGIFLTTLAPYACSNLEGTLESRLLIDAICFVMGHEDKEFVQIGYILLDEVIFTATATLEAVLNEIKTPCSSALDVLVRLPLMQYLSKAITDMLYHPSWFVKWGGCCMLLRLRHRLPTTWFKEYLLGFLRGLIHCFHDLANQMGQGALSLARECATSLVEFVFSAEAILLQAMVATNKEESSTQSRESSKRTVTSRRRAAATTKRGTNPAKRKSASSKGDCESPGDDSPEEADTSDATASSSALTETPLMKAVLPELVEALLSETKVVREQARSLLRLVSECLSLPLGTILKPYLPLIDAWLPPKNRLNRLTSLPLSTQIAVLETNYFLCREGPELLQYCPATRRCDNRFLFDLRAIMDAPLPAASTTGQPSIIRGNSAPHQTLLSSLQLQQAIDLKVTACQVLSTTHYLEGQKSATLAALFKGMCCDSSAVHKPAFDSTMEFVKHTTVDVELRHTYVKPILQNLRQPASVRLATVRQLAYCAELFPSTFSERFCETIQAIQTSVASVSSPDTLLKSVELLSALIDLFHLIPLAGEKYVKVLMNLVIRVEQTLNAEQTSQLRLPLLRFLVRYPEETFRQLLTGFTRPHDGHAHRLILRASRERRWLKAEYMMTLPESKPLADYLIANTSILTDLLRLNEKDPDSVYHQTPFRLPRSKGPLMQASPSHLALRLLHSLHIQRPGWLASTLSSSTDDESILTSCDSPVVQTLLNYWGSASFVERHSSLTLIQLQQLQPSVDLELLLDDPSESGRKSFAINQHSTPASAEAATNQAMAGVKVASGLMEFAHWDEPSLILDCLIACAEVRPEDFDLLFYVVGGMSRLRCVGYNSLNQYLQRLVLHSPISWHRALFLHFIKVISRRSEINVASSGSSSSSKTGSKKKQVLSDTSTDSGPMLSLQQYLNTPESQFKLLSQLILPCVQQALEKSPAEFVSLRNAANADVPSEDDLVHLFVDVLLSDEAAKNCTGLRIMYYQLASLFVYYAPEYVQDSTVKTQSYRLRAITAFAWPCVTSNLNVVDLQEKYTGLQVLAHLIARFNQIMGKATLQVFHCLAKGTHTEVKKIVNPALDILLPAWVTGPEEQKVLAASTRKILTEDHGTQSCIHLLSLIVRHADLFYPVRQSILNLIIIVISRLSSQQLPIDQRRLILDVIEVIVRWDQRSGSEQALVNPLQSVDSPVLHAEPTASDEAPPLQPLSSSDHQIIMPIDKGQRDQLTNTMIRFACQSIDATQNGISSEASARKALSQVEFTLSSDVWGGGNCDLRLTFIDRLLCPDEASCQSGGAQQQNQNQPHTIGALQSSGIFMTLEVLRVVYSTLESPTLLANVKCFSKSLTNLFTRYPMNVRLIRACASFVKALLTKFPADLSSRQKITSFPELYELYDVVLKFIQESFTLFGEGTNKAAFVSRLQSAFCLLTTTQQVPINPYSFVDRCLTQLMKLFHRLIHDVTSPVANGSPQDNASTNQLTELLIQGLDIFKSRLNVVNTETRKSAFGPDLMHILDRSKDPKLFRAVVRTLRDWVNVPKAEEHFAPTTREKVAFFVRLWAAYPRWVEQPEVARDILECLYQVFSNISQKTHDIFVKMEQAFCCGLLSPLPDVREKYIDLFLTGSDITATPFLVDRPVNENKSEPAAALSAPPTKSNLLTRLLFLLTSNSWDEAHFKDGFWLPVFFDVILCDADLTRPGIIAQAEARFASLVATRNDQSSSVSVSAAPSDPFETGDVEMLKLKPDSEGSSSLMETQGQTSKSTFQRLMEQQAAAFIQLKSISFRDTLRGFLSLVHLRPAIASEMFGQLWHCLWHRFLLRESENFTSLVGPGVLTDPQVPHLTEDPVNPPAPSTEASSSLEASQKPSPLAATAGTVSGEGTPKLSPRELRGFLLSQINRFITSDDHVNPNECIPSPLGCFVAGLATTKDSLLLSLPLPVLSYVGYNHNQWYTMALVLEFLCARGQQVSLLKGHNSPVDNDLTYSLEPAVDGSGDASEAPGSVPLGTAALSLIALYDAMAEGDHFVSAWWHRLSSNCAGSHRLKNQLNPPGPRLSPERSSDFLTALTAFSQGGLTKGLETALGLLSSRSATCDALPAYPAASNVDSSSLALFSDQINKTRLNEYCIRALKQMGQWDNLETLASVGVAQNPGTSVPSTVSAAATGCSPFWGLRVDAAWRHRDWSEVFSGLSAASACVAGRRAGSGDYDSFVGGAGGQSASGGPPTSSGTISSGDTNSGGNAMQPGLLQIIESESHRVMCCILSEWRRLPHIISNQHIRLLQACQQAIEINEGNILLMQHCAHSLTTGGSTSSTPSGSAGRSSMTPTMYDYKTVFRSWQGRPPLISDDLCFWNDLLTWRQIVLEKIINNSAYSHKFTQERNNLLGMCHRERSLTLVQMVKGYRKCGLSNLAQKRLDAYSHGNLPPMFEKTKQEIKLKIADSRKEELLEASCWSFSAIPFGLELMEKTNIQQYEKKDKAKFFCYKAVFFSHFNKGDEATKNFGYATQMQDNLHKAWSVFGDFLENVYSSNRTAKRETAVSSTGVFAMQALMEAATVAGTSQRTSHPDLARSIWLLTLDDAGDFHGSPAGTPSATAANTSPTTSSVSTIASGSQSQRLARMFEERASRVHPDAFLPWLPSLSTCLLRPEGRFVASALRGIALAYPTALASVLRGLQHQLATEVDRDRRISAALTELSPDQRRRLDEAYGHCLDLARDESRKRAASSVTTGPVDHAQLQASVSAGAAAKRTKKRVVVVMRGAEGEKLGETTSCQPSESIREAPSSDLQDLELDDDDPDAVNPTTAEESPVGDFEYVGGVHTSYMSPSVGEGLHRVNLLFAQLRQRHPARLYVSDRFVECTAGRLLPSWSENLLLHLRKVLSQLHKLVWAQVSHLVRSPSSAASPVQATLQSVTSFILPSWMYKELFDIISRCGLPPPNPATTDDFATDDSDNRPASSLSFSENAQLAYTILAREADSDPCFKPLKEKLLAMISNAESKSVFEVIMLLTNELIPLVEKRVEMLPHTFYLSDRGAGFLIELIAASSCQSLQGPLPRLYQGISTSTGTASAAVSYSSSALIELPGEAIRLKTVPALNPQNNFYNHSNHQQLSTANEAQQPHLLYLADIIPTVVRVPSGGGRRLAVRANNGRMFHYDIPCLPRELPAGRAVSLASTDCTEATSLAPALMAYDGWRETWCPPHLFQVLNDIAARCPETAKRRLRLVTSRTLDVGPCGMRITQAGTSAPAASVVAANSIAFGNPTVTGVGSLLAQQLHSTAASSAATGQLQAGGLPFTVPTGPPSMLPPKPSPDFDAAFPRPDAFSEQQQQQPQQSEKHPATSNPTVSNANCSGYAGSRGVALEVAGQPAGLDTGCYAACVTLADVVDAAALNVPSTTRPLTSRQLIAAFFDRLSGLATTDVKLSTLKSSLVKIFEDLLQLVPQASSLNVPAHSPLGFLNDECNTSGSVVQVWAYRRFVDAESYWLFRHGVALCSGSLGLAEILFSMTPLSATGVILDPRVGRLESRGLCFDLPATPNATITPQFHQQKEPRPVDLVSKSSTALASIFASNFAPLVQPAAAPPNRASVAPAVCLPSRPAPLRLTPQLAALICQPGVPATVGPFAAAMSTMNQAVVQRRATVIACLRTLLRDDFILWHRGRQAAVHANLLADLLDIDNDDAAMGTSKSPINVPDLSNECLVQMIALSVEGFSHRSRVLSSSDKTLGDVINGACSHENLARMDPSWLPWF
ncbi:unnamed protein product [Mesocestoides corti]|uniref:FATC domain-containing protein n=1 Tax=Mesocestoides corti TaxID=53468 RepID=A0A158QW44_MESCO|nr:unnamed protein product [Mesocestoides corti]